MYISRLDVVLILCSLGLHDLSSALETERWNQASCKSVTQLFKAKAKITNKLNNSLKVKNGGELDVHVLNTIRIFKEELDDTETAFFDALDGLRKLLKEDYKSVVKIKEAIRQRLDALKGIALRQEEQYNAISEEAEKSIVAANSREGKYNGSLIQQLIDGVWGDIYIAADKLEEQINDKTFEQMKDAKGASIEAVLRLDEEGKPLNKTSDSKETSEGNGNEMNVLVDSQSNQFVLAKAKDSTVPHEDLHFIKDIIFIVLLSFSWSYVCSLVQLPTMFGFVISGMILGPSGFNVIKLVVQVETLGEFGVFFILFTVGLEFSPKRIKQVWKVAVGGSTLMMLVTILFGLFWGTCFGIIPQQSAFVAACLSLSSTPLVAKFVEGKHEHEKAHTNGDSDYTSSLLGILVMQDVHLGLLVALLPALAGHQSSGRQTVQEMIHGTISSTGALSNSFEGTMWIIFDVIMAMFTLFILYIFLAKIVMGYFYRLLLHTGSEELVFLGTVSVAFSMLTITEHLGISMELGCFVAGVVISSRGENLVKQVTSLVSPMRDFFSCLFFASIGLHVFPTFVVNEFSVILTLTMGVVVMKFFVAVFVLRLFLSENHSVKYIVAAGLAQVSEFSFVLGSRARRFHLISREVYLIILSVTTLTLLLAPLLWRLSLWGYGGEKLRKLTTSQQQKKPI